MHLTVLLLVVLVGSVWSLDVSFIPNDENAPLPLSAKYRDSLRKLCTLVVSGGRLPPEAEAKRNVLVKMCKKLKRDDTNVETSTKSAGKVSAKALFYSLLGIGGGYITWNNRKFIGHKFRSLFTNKRVASANVVESKEIIVSMDNNAEIQAQQAVAREARLKRFAGLNSDAAIQSAQ